MIVEMSCFQRNPETADRIDLTYEGIATYLGLPIVFSKIMTELT